MTTVEQICAEIAEARGLVSVAARRLGITRQAIYKRAKDHPEILEALEEARELTTDVAEGKLFEAIRQGQAWAVCFYLKCQAKDRGYVEKQQHEHSGEVKGPPVIVRLPTPMEDATEWAERYRVADEEHESGNGARSNGR